MQVLSSKSRPVSKTIRFRKAHHSTWRSASTPAAATKAHVRWVTSTSSPLKGYPQTCPDMRSCVFASFCTRTDRVWTEKQTAGVSVHLIPVLHTSSTPLLIGPSTALGSGQLTRLWWRPKISISSSNVGHFRDICLCIYNCWSLNCILSYTSILCDCDFVIYFGVCCYFKVFRTFERLT